MTSTHTTTNTTTHATTSNCTYCLETINPTQQTTHRFGCGCELNLHESCHADLMEQGRLRYCWYCQRTTLNASITSPLVYSVLPHDTHHPHNYPPRHPLVMLYVIGMLLYLIMINVNITDVLYRIYKIETRQDRFIPLICLFPSMILSYFIVNYASYRLIKDTTIQYYPARILVVILGILQMFVLLSNQYMNISLGCAIVNIVYQYAFTFRA